MRTMIKAHLYNYFTKFQLIFHYSSCSSFTFYIISFIHSFFFLSHFQFHFMAFFDDTTTNRWGMFLSWLAWLYNGSIHCWPRECTAVQIFRMQQEGLYRCTAYGSWLVFAQQTKWGKCNRGITANQATSKMNLISKNLLFCMGIQIKAAKGQLHKFINMQTI